MENEESSEADNPGKETGFSKYNGDMWRIFKKNWHNQKTIFKKPSRPLSENGFDRKGVPRRESEQIFRLWFPLYTPEVMVAWTR